MKIQWNNSWSV